MASRILPGDQHKPEGNTRHPDHAVWLDEYLAVGNSHAERQAASTRSLLIHASFGSPPEITGSIAGTRGTDGQWNRFELPNQNRFTLVGTDQWEERDRKGDLVRTYQNTRMSLDTDGNLHRVSTQDGIERILHPDGSFDVQHGANTWHYAAGQFSPSSAEVKRTDGGTDRATFTDGHISSVQFANGNTATCSDDGSYTVHNAAGDLVTTFRGTLILDSNGNGFDLLGAAGTDWKKFATVSANKEQATEAAPPDAHDQTTTPLEQADKPLVPMPPEEVDRKFKELLQQQGGPFTLIKADIKHEAMTAEQFLQKYPNEAIRTPDGHIRIHTKEAALSPDGTGGQQVSDNDLVMVRYDASGRSLPWTPELSSVVGDPAKGIEARYVPTGGQKPGEPGPYLPAISPTDMAILTEPIKIKTKWGEAQGQPGDMLVRYGDMDYNIVSRDDLRASYDRAVNARSLDYLQSVQAERPAANTPPRLDSLVRAAQTQHPDDPQGMLKLRALLASPGLDPRLKKELAQHIRNVEQEMQRLAGMDPAERERLIRQAIDIANKTAAEREAVERADSRGGRYGRLLFISQPVLRLMLEAFGGI